MEKTSDSAPLKPVLGSMSNDTEAIPAAPAVLDEVPGNKGQEGPAGISADDLLVSGTAPFSRATGGRGRFESILVGTDERVRIFDTMSNPWRMICSLEILGTNGAPFLGTAFFVGPRTLLTSPFLHKRANSCSRYESEIPWRSEISASGTGPSVA